MNTMKQICLVLLAITVVSVATSDASEIGPQGVSPGAPDRLAEVSAACPTFNWEAVPGVEHYELLAYRLAADEVDVSAVDLSTATEVLYIAVPGGATGWTPESAACFDPGERYAWFVRAVMDAEVGEESDWSPPRFFEVASAPSFDELERAIEVLRRWEAATGNGSPMPASAAAPDAVTASAAVPAAAAAPDSGSGSGSGSNHLKSVTTGTAAIRGEQPDPSGDTYGVVGTSASPNGAGIGAANTAGGPDLVLDGAVPAELTEAGVDRSSASPQTFSFFNTGGGGMMLDIEGIPIVTTTTDQDTVGALTCGSGQLAKWNGATWVCATDLDTDTLSGLSCATWQIPKWNGSIWECNYDWDTLFNLGCNPGEIAKRSATEWVCAADLIIAYSAGYGIQIVNGQLTLDPALFSTQIYGIHNSTSVEPSVAMGSDGLPLISLADIGSGLAEFLVTHCEDPDCISSTTSTIDSGGSVGLFSSVAIGVDGHGLISYYDSTNSRIKVAHCNDVDCLTAEKAIVDSTGGPGGRYSQLAIGSDGRGLIAYYDSTNRDLKVAHCSDASCSSSTPTTLDATDDAGQGVGIAIGADGFGIISYWQISTDVFLKVAHCNDNACSSATSSILDFQFSTPLHFGSSVVIGTDGLPLIVYPNSDTGELKAAHCDDLTCSSATITVIDSRGFLEADISTVLGSNGLPLISYREDTTGALKVAHCTNVQCTDAVVRVVGTYGGGAAWSNSITVDPYGRGLVVYGVDSAGAQVAHLPLGF